MYERLLRKHVERLERKEAMLTQILQTAVKAPTDPDQCQDSKDGLFHQKLRRMFEEFGEGAEGEHKSNGTSAPSSPASTFSRSASSLMTSSEHETCSENSEDDDAVDERPIRPVGQAWPEDVPDPMPTQLLTPQKPSPLPAQPTAPCKFPYTTSGSTSLPLPSLSDLANLTGLLQSPLQPSLPIARNLSDSSPWTDRPAIISRNTSTESIGTANNNHWASLVIAS
jgi:hypothetical protein